MLSYFEEKSSLMNGTSGDFFFFYKFLWKDHSGDRVIEKKKMEKTKVQKEVNVELFIVE